MNRKIRVLFIPRWYPNRYDPMPGLFIRRQAESITGTCDVAVIYLHPDPACPNHVEVDVADENSVRVMRVYYRPPGDSSGLWGRIRNLWTYYRAGMKAVRSIRAFAPDVIHAHILTRAGVIGWRAALEMKCPLIVSEHWSRYFPGNGTYRGWLRKLLTVRVASFSVALVAVSESLKTAMEDAGITSRRFRVIPNVVDSSLFSRRLSVPYGPVKKMVHISCFDDRSKNISGFLRALRELYTLRTDFHCLMVGMGPDWDDMKDYAGFLRIPEESISFTGLVEGEKLAGILREADFSVLSSNYETFGTVIAESLACGVPVVSTRVGIACELVHEGNGMLVEPGDEAGLTAALSAMLDKCREYDPASVSMTPGDRFDSKTVGRQLADLYKEVAGIKD